MTLYLGTILFAFGYLFAYTAVEGKGKLNPLDYLKAQ